jgi:hypothetical protein
MTIVATAASAATDVLLDLLALLHDSSICGSFRHWERFD